MSYNKFLFKSFIDFKTVQDLASDNGIKTAEEFNRFLEENYKHLKNDNK